MTIGPLMITPEKNGRKKTFEKANFNGNSRKEVSLKVEQTSRLKFSNCIEHLVICAKKIFHREGFQQQQKFERVA